MPERSALHKGDDLRLLGVGISPRDAEASVASSHSPEANGFRPAHARLDTKTVGNDLISFALELVSRN
jgi:hypothetical protein